MADHQRNGLSYNCDEKYAPGHRCKKQKLFQIDMPTQDLTEDITTERHWSYRLKTPTLRLKQISNLFLHEERSISLHALSGISTLTKP
jgi:hypothetical protein